MGEAGRPAARPTVGLTLEGGGYRGLYSSGILDVLMEEGIAFDHVVGVSAGAAFGCNLKSRQPGRAIRYNKRFCADRRYAGWGNLLVTGDFFSRDFAYGEVPLVIDPLDAAAFRANPLRFTVVATDIETGEAVYHDLGPGDTVDITWIRASASIPVFARPVALEGRLLLDGGIADSIPVAWMRAQGAERQVAVLTQPAGYRKGPNRLMGPLRLLFHRYPRLVELLANRHLRYNACLDEVAAGGRAGELFVIRPSEDVSVPTVCRDSEALERIYQVGRTDGTAALASLRAYLGQ